MRATRAMPSVWSLRKPLGDDHGQRPADDLLGRPAEHPLGPAVPGEQPPRAVGRDDRVHRRLGDRLELLPGGGQGLVGPAPLDQGAELLGDPGDALQTAQLAGPLVGDEQLQHRHHALGAGHGHGQGFADPGPLGRRGPVEAERVADVVQLQRLALGPGQAGQALAELVVDLLAGRVQLLEPVAGAVPGRAADEHLAGRQPHLAHGAAGEVADCLDGGGQDLVAGVGLADQLEHELEEAALVLGALHVGQVADHGDGQLGAASAVADQRKVPAAPDQLAGEDPHPAALDLAAVQPFGQHLAHGRLGQLLVGRVGQRRQGAATQPADRAHPEQLLKGVVGDDDPSVAVQHAGRRGRFLNERLRPERAGRSPPPAPSGLAPVRPHSAPPTVRRVRAMHAGRPD